MNATRFTHRNLKELFLITTTCSLLSVVLGTGGEPVWADPPRQKPNDTRDKRAPLTAAQLQKVLSARAWSNQAESRLPIRRRFTQQMMLYNHH